MLQVEERQAAIDAAISTTSANSNGAPTLNLSVSDPPSTTEVQLDELILALRRP